MISPDQSAASYDEFAWFYNKYWSAEIPYQILSALDSLVFQRLATGGRVLDLCCGTGQIAAKLSERGFEVMGIDESSAMLQHARRNAPAVNFIRSDARRFEQPPIFEVAISTFDSLNHILELSELKEVFRRVHSSLVTGGKFVFDMNMEQGFFEHWENCFSILEADGVCVLQGGYDQLTGLGQYDVTLFRHIEENNWRRSDFTIIERCYSAEEIIKSLNEAGFGNVSVYDAAEDLELMDHTGRSFFSDKQRGIGEMMNAE